MSDHQLATETAQLVIRGEIEPPLPLAVSFGAPLDMVDGTIRCPKCGMDSVQLVQATSFPSISFPTNAAIMLSCRMCQGEFAIGVDAEGGRCVLRTTQPRG
jgi:hypothetical protein